MIDINVDHQADPQVAAEPLPAAATQKLAPPVALGSRALSGWLCQVGGQVLHSLDRRCMGTVILLGMLLGSPAGISICTVQATLRGLSSPSSMALLIYAGMGFLGALAFIINVRCVVLPVVTGTVRSWHRRSRMKGLLATRFERMHASLVYAHPQD